MSFWIKIKSQTELDDIVSLLKEYKAIGRNIAIGSYLPDNMPIIFLNDFFNENTVGVSVKVDERKYTQEKFPDLFGVKKIMPNIVERKDISGGNKDVPAKLVKNIDEFKTELINLVL